jgi:hypothetical protein
MDKNILCTYLSSRIVRSILSERDSTIVFFILFSFTKQLVLGLVDTLEKLSLFDAYSWSYSHLCSTPRCVNYPNDHQNTKDGLEKTGWCQTHRGVKTSSVFITEL